jgi:ABC-type multidrug transport system fused ATPase/permease subunit
VMGSAFETLGIAMIFAAVSLLTQGDVAESHPRLRPLLAILGNPTHVRLVVMYMLGLVGIFVIKTAFLAFLTWRQTTFAFDVHVDLCQRLFSTYLRQPYTFHLQRNSATLIRNLVTGVWDFTVLVTNCLGLVTEGLVLVGVSALLLAVEPLGAFLVVLLLGSAAWVFQRVTRSHAERWGVARQHHEGLRIQHLQQGLGSAKDVKLLGREDDFLAQYDVHNVKSGRAAQLQMTLQQFPRLFLELLAVSGLATLVLAALLQGRDVAEIAPTAGLFAVAAFRLMPSATRIMAGVQHVYYDLPIINFLYEDVNLPAPTSVTRNSTLTSLRREVQVVDLGFSYPDAVVPTLNGVGMVIHKGESVGIIGPTGSGKSTLVDLILGLLTPTSGDIRVDGEDIQQNLRAWQDQIGYVPQSIYLTDDTLRRNVAFGLADGQIDEASVQRAVGAAQLQEFVASLPRGLDTVVGERGVRLSGGQRQRIGIARALYHDPGVLVLDEATSSLDSDTEKDVVHAVRALHGRKTVLIVTHRLSTVEHCDRLYRLSGAEGESASLSLERTPAGSITDC